MHFHPPPWPPASDPERIKRVPLIQRGLHIGPTKHVSASGYQIPWGNLDDIWCPMFLNWARNTRILGKEGDRSGLGRKGRGRSWVHLSQVPSSTIIASVSCRLRECWLPTQTNPVQPSDDQSKGEKRSSLDLPMQKFSYINIPGTRSFFTTNTPLVPEQGLLNTGHQWLLARDPTESELNFLRHFKLGETSINTISEDTFLTGGHCWRIP